MQRAYSRVNAVWRNVARIARLGLLGRAAALVLGCSVVEAAIKRQRVCMLAQSDSFKTSIDNAYIWAVIGERECKDLHEARRLRNRIADSAVVPSLAETGSALGALWRVHYHIEVGEVLAFAHNQPSPDTAHSPDADTFTFSYDTPSLTILRTAKSSDELSIRHSAVLLATALARQELATIARSHLGVLEFNEFCRKDVMSRLREATDRAWLPPLAPDTAGALAHALAERNDIAHEEVPKSTADATSIETLISVVEHLHGVAKKLPVVTNAPQKMDREAAPTTDTLGLEQTRRLPQGLRRLYCSQEQTDVVLDSAGAWLNRWNIPFGLLVILATFGSACIRLLSGHPALDSDSFANWLSLLTSMVGLLLLGPGLYGLIAYREKGSVHPINRLLRRLPLLALALATIAHFTCGFYDIWRGLHVLSEQHILWAGILFLVLALVLLKWTFTATAWILCLRIDIGGLLLLGIRPDRRIPSANLIRFLREYPVTFAAAWAPCVAAAACAGAESEGLALVFACGGTLAGLVSASHYLSPAPKLRDLAVWIRSVGIAIAGLLGFVYLASEFSPVAGSFLRDLGNRLAGISPLWVIELRWWWYAVIGGLLAIPFGMMSERIRQLPGPWNRLLVVSPVLLLGCASSLVGIAIGKRTIALPPRASYSTEPVVHLLSPRASFRTSGDRVDLVISVNARERDAAIIAEFPDDGEAQSLHVYPFAAEEVADLRGWTYHAQVPMLRSAEPVLDGGSSYWRYETVIHGLTGAESGRYLIRARRSFLGSTETTSTYRFGPAR